MTTLIIGDGGGSQVVGVLDSEISQPAPANPLGTGTTSYIGTSTSSAKRQLYKFTGFPAGSVVVSSAVISIYNADATASSRGIEARKLLTAFVENQVTWNKRDSGTNWNVAGVLGGTDVDATVVATGTMPTTGGTVFTVAGAGLNALVQGWMDGSITNHGIILNCVDDTVTFDNVLRRITNHEHGSASLRPYLTVTYISVTPPSLTISDPTVSHLSGTATFTLTASGTFGSDITVDYATADVTATAGVDYVAKTGTATITAGQTTTTVVVDILP